MKYNINYYDMKEQCYVHLIYTNKEKAQEKFRELKLSDDDVCVEVHIEYEEISICNESTDNIGRTFVYNILYDRDENEYLLEYFYCYRNNSDAETKHELWFDTLEELNQFVKEM